MPAGAAPAVALLELLVDHLGNPPAVLELFGSLDASLRGDRRIAGAVAVAAALFGDVPLARERLLDVRGERAAEAWAHLAQHAIRTEDAGLAREARDALARESPAHPAIHALDDHLEARRLSARAEVEAQLLAAEGLAPSERRRMAEALLAQYPRSAVGARVLRAVVAEETSARIDALLARAEEHAPADDAAAVAAWREAISLGADRTAFAARLEAAEDRLRDERVARAAAEIAATFARGEAEAALTRALEAEAGAVEALRATLDVGPLEALSRAEQIARAAPSVRAKACARAALAWTEADRAIAAAEGGPEARATAARLLDRNEKLLDPLPEVAALRERLAGLEQSERRAAARSALEAASEALERGELDEARRSLDRVRAADLAPEQREACGALLARVERLEHERTFDATVERRERERQWLDVAAACERELQATGHSFERRRQLAERAAEARSKGREAYRFAVLPVGSVGWFPPATRGRASSMAVPRSDSTETTVLAVTGGAGWLVVRGIDLEADTIRFCLVMRPPSASPSAIPASVRRSGDRLSIVTSDARMYTLDLAALAPCEEMSFGAARADAPPLQLVCDSHSAWQLDSLRSTIAVFDTRTGQLRRELSNSSVFCRIANAPLIARATHLNGGHALEPFHARGTKAGPAIALPGALLSAVQYGGRVYVKTQRLADGGGSLPAHALVLCDLEQGTSSVLIELGPDAVNNGSYAVTSDAIYFVFDLDGATAIDAYTPDERGGMRRRWRTRVTSAQLFAVPEGCPWVLVTTLHHQRCRALTLSPSCVTSETPSVRLDEGPATSGPLPLNQAVATRSRELSVAIDPDTESALGITAIDHFTREGDEELALVSLERVARVGGAKWIDDFLTQLGRVRPLPPSLRIWEAKRALEQARWSEAEAVLDSVEPEITDPDLAAWCSYARGIIAYVRRADIEAASEHWASAGGTSKAATTCARLVERMGELHGEDAAAPDDGQAALLAAIREADALAGAGDLDGAIAALDQHVVWRAGEPQSFARLAHWHLERVPRTAAEWLRKLEVLAELTLLAEDPSELVLAVPGAHWSEERLGEVHARARAWLDDARPPSV